MLIRKLCDQPQLWIIDDFLSSRECTWLKSMAIKKGLTRSKVTPYPGEEKGKTRKSFTYILKESTQKTIVTIEKRIEEFTKIPLENGEDLQITYYPTGGYFHPHYDIDLNAKTGLHDRIATILIYLNDVEEGGETLFPDIGINIVPKKGRAILWYNFKNIPGPNSGSELILTLPKTLIPETESYHSGTPIKKGEKWIATKWLHAKRYDRPT